MAVLVAGLAVASLARADGHFERFLAWFPGEYDNHEQVWLDKQTEGVTVHEHIHHVFLPVDAPKVGEHVFFVRQTEGDTGEVYRLRLYRFTEVDDRIQLDIYRFADEAAWDDAHTDPSRFADLEPEALATTPGCEVYWDWTGEYFAGSMTEGACTFISQRSGKTITITDDLRLTESELWIRDEAFDAEGGRVFGHPEGIHHKNRKVRYFTGWASVRPGGMNADPEEEEWLFLPRFMIHTEGQIVPIIDADGTETGYSVQLAKLTYQGRNPQPILKIGIIDNETGKTLRYAWANPDAIQIGINLRWMQTGLKQKTEDIHFGFDPTPEPTSGD
ncbi:MAG: chromophore lyase CpcT/CpeT [Pseudomonadota bacterium]